MLNNSPSYMMFGDVPTPNRSQDSTGFQQKFAVCEQNIESNFKCYSCLLYTYLVFSVISLFLKWDSTIIENLWNVMILVYYTLMIALWVIGIKAIRNKSSNLQWIFQNGLIIYMALTIIDLFSILANSYTYNPFLTFAMLSFQVAGGIFFPFYAYTSGTTLRKYMEERERILHQLNPNTPILQL